MDVEFFLGDRVDKRQALGVKIQAALHPRAIEAITKNRQSKAFFAVDSKLVGPSGIRCEFDSAEVTGRMLFHPNPLHMRFRLLAAFTVDDLIGAIGDIGSERKGDFGFLFLEDSFKQRLIGPPYPLGSKETMHAAERFPGERYDDKT